MTKTVVGIYNSFQTANQVVRELADAGFHRDRISLIAGDANKEYARELESGRTTTGTTDDRASNVGSGAGTGAAIGGVGGLLVGLGALAIPGIGPAIAAGPIAAALAGAGIGAAAGGVIGALVGLGIPDEDAHIYAESVKRGNVLVAVEAEDNRVDQATRIMERTGLVDLDRESESWRSSGWSRFGEDDRSTTRAQSTRDTQRTTQPRGNGQTGRGRTTDDETIEVIEEDVKIGKRTTEGGGVRVRSFVREVPVEEQVRLREEHVNVERRPVDRPASARDLENFKEGTIEVTETSEEAVVSKDARVVEEVHVHKDVDEHVETVRDTARRTDVEVEQMGASGRTRTSGDFSRHDSDFRSHWQTNYGNRGGAYETYQPAYRYGYDLASDPRYQGRNWRDVEPEARREWENTNKGTWEEFKDSVRHGWEKVTGQR